MNKILISKTINSFTILLMLLLFVILCISFVSCCLFYSCDQAWLQLRNLTSAQIIAFMIKQGGDSYSDNVLDGVLNPGEEITLSQTFYFGTYTAQVVFDDEIKIEVEDIRLKEFGIYTLEITEEDRQ